MNVTNHAAAADGDTPVLFNNSICNRLFWTLNGPLESAIQVMPNQWYDPDAVMEPYFRPPATPGAEPSWHPISLEPLTTPKSLTITVKPYCIEAWEDLWRDLHWQSFAGTEEGQATYANYYGSDAERHGEYGMQRPRSEDAKLQVKATGDFLTVHDYVSQVHPWLMGMRERLLEALGGLDGRKAPWAPETKLLVDNTRLLMIREEKDLTSWRKKPFVPPPGFVPLTREEAHRQSIQRRIAESKARAQELEAAAAAATEQAAKRGNIGVE